MSESKGSLKSSKDKKRAKRKKKENTRANNNNHHHNNSHNNAEKSNGDSSTDHNISAPSPREDQGASAQHNNNNKSGGAGPAHNTNYLDDKRKRIGRDYESWQIGTVITTPCKRVRYRITRRVDDGHAGVVFRAHRVNDKEAVDEHEQFAIKVPRKDTEKQFRKLHQECDKNKELAALHLPLAEIVEEGGDYLVKRWIDGIRGDEWFKVWNEDGRPLNDPPFVALCAMFDRLSSQGVYVQNLKDLNVIWTGEAWVVIDVGYFKYNMRPQVALGRFYETFDGRWNKPKYNRTKGRFKFNCPPIADIRGQDPDCYVTRTPEVLAKKKQRLVAKKLMQQHHPKASLAPIKTTQQPESQHHDTDDERDSTPSSQREVPHPAEGPDGSSKKSKKKKRRDSHEKSSENGNKKGSLRKKKRKTKKPRLAKSAHDAAAAKEATPRKGKV